MEKKTEYTFLRPTVLHVMVAAAAGFDPLPVLAQSKDGKKYGKIPIMDYIQLAARGEI